MTAKMKKRPVSVALVTLLVLGLTKPTFPTPQENRTFVLENIGVAFDLPKQYSILYEEMPTARYAIRISFGKDLAPNHLKTLGVDLVFWPGAYNGRRHIPEYTPSRYVDAEYRRAQDAHRQDPHGLNGEPKYLTLLGNKAVEYTEMFLLCCTYVVGYLRPDQLSGRAATYKVEYLVRIEAGDEDRESWIVFKELVKSLRVVK